MAKPILPKSRKPSETLTCSAGCTHKLILDTNHPRSSYGLGVMRIAWTDKVFDGAALHADSGARIETTNPLAVCGALGIAYPDRQVQLV